MTDEHTDVSADQDKTNDKDEQKRTYPETDDLSTGRLISTGVRLILVSFLLTSVLYLLASTGIGQLVWPQQAKGSLVQVDGKVVGSSLIGQPFHSDGYFHPRPSSTGYDGMNSGSANLSPQNKKLTQRVKEDLQSLREQGIRAVEVPASFITESGSALDPHIVPESAYLQVPRVSEATGIASDRLRKIIDDLTRTKFLGLYGLKRVNVLTLNMKIDQIREAE